jgi:hypothetical protein
MSRQVPKTARLEIKFSAYESEVDVLRKWLRIHSAGFKTQFPNRWVNNVYFDTYEYFAYSENFSGASARTKVRYRWYGQSDSLQNGTLEIKCKRNYFGWKLRFKTTDLPSTDKLSWREIRKTLIQELEPEAKLWLRSNPLPVMINRYHREYYVTRDDKIRVTIDTHQRVTDQRYKPYPNLKHKANLPKTLVLEIKFDRRDRKLASSIVQGLPLRISRNSKYMIAVQSVQGF